MEVIDGFLIWTWVFISDLVFAWAVADLSSDCAYAQVFQALVGLFGLFSEAESMPRCGVCKSESSRFTWLVLSRSFLTLLDIVEFYNYGLKSPKIIAKLVNHKYNSRLLTFILLSKISVSHQARCISLMTLEGSLVAERRFLQSSFRIRLIFCTIVCKAVLLIIYRLRPSIALVVRIDGLATRCSAVHSYPSISIG